MQDKRRAFIERWSIDKYVWDHHSNQRFDSEDVVNNAMLSQTVRYEGFNRCWGDYDYLI